MKSRALFPSFSCSSPLVRLACWVVGAAAWALTSHLQAAPRLISDGTPSCVTCHVAPQGRGLLNGYGRGIDIGQSFSDRDFTGEILGRFDAKYADESWKGYFGNVLADFVVTGRLNQEFDSGKADPAFSALYRQIIFGGKAKRLRVNTEIGFRDTGLPDTRLGENDTAVGGDRLFVKKLMLEWRMKGTKMNSGSELSIGRDYLPIGQQIDDHTAYILHLNRNGIYDFPLQVKYMAWDEKSLYAAFLYAPTFNEAANNREYGAGGLYEYYLTDRLVLGVQGVLGLGNESDRLRLGGYVRWGISRKWSVLAEVDYTQFWNSGSTDEVGGQLTAFLQLHYKHTEWLVSSVTGNFAHSDLLTAGDSHLSARYTLNARLSRNLTVGATYTFGDMRRNLDDGQEGALFATIKF